jgi:hypothetical protein
MRALTSLIVAFAAVAVLGRPAAAQACGVTLRDAVNRYYHGVSAHHYPTAWSCLRTATRKSFGGYTRWRDGYATTAWVHVLSAVTTDQAAGLGRVRFTIRSCRGDGIVETFRGTWFTQDGPAGWRIGAPKAVRVSRARRSAC